jgi:hypothetical protein
MLKNQQLTDTIQQETLAKSINQTETGGFSTTVKVDGAELKISLTKI